MQLDTKTQYAIANVTDAQTYASQPKMPYARPSIIMDDRAAPPVELGTIGGVTARNAGSVAQLLRSQSGRPTMIETDSDARPYNGTTRLNNTYTVAAYGGMEVPYGK